MGGTYSKIALLTTLFMIKMMMMMVVVMMTMKLNIIMCILRIAHVKIHVLIFSAQLDISKQKELAVSKVKYSFSMLAVLAK
jgi:hypothetical protein